MENFFDPLVDFFVAICRGGDMILVLMVVVRDTLHRGVGVEDGLKRLACFTRNRVGVDWNLKDGDVSVGFDEASSDAMRSSAGARVRSVA